MLDILKPVKIRSGKLVCIKNINKNMSVGHFDSLKITRAYIKNDLTSRHILFICKLYENIYFIKFHSPNKYCLFQVIIIHAKKSIFM